MKRLLPITLALVLASSSLTFADTNQKNLVPIREVAESYEYKVSWNNEDKTITLKKADSVFVATVGSMDYIINGEKLTIPDSPVQIINNVAFVPSNVINTVLSLGADEGDKETPGVATDGYIQMAEEFLSDMMNKNYDKCAEKLNGIISSEDLGQAWESATKDLGSFEKIDKEKDIAKVIESGDGQSYIGVAQFLEFENGGLIVNNAIYEDGSFLAFAFDYYTPEGKGLNMPSTIEEVEYKVGVESTQNAKLTKAKDSTSDTVVIMLSGSGPNNLDEEILGNKPFRDIAWGLAEEGIDTFRFDKVTYSVNQGDMTIENPETFTIQEEYVNDVVKIREMLLEMGYKHIYLLGHSQGAMVAPRIYDEVNGGFDGLILMAGTPRTLTEVQIMQNYDFLEVISEEYKAEYTTIIEAEVEKYENLENFTDEELLSQSIFAIPAYYVKEAESYDTSELAKGIDKPILVLQGAKDFQVSVKEDYELWKEVLADNAQTKFVLYDDLGHLFTKTPENQTNTISDYTPPQLVDKRVINDIVSFIK